MYDSENRYSYGEFNNSSGGGQYSGGNYSGGGRKGPNVFTKIVLYMLAGIIISVGSVGVYRLIDGSNEPEKITASATPAPQATQQPGQTVEKDYTTAGNAASLLNLITSDGTIQTPAEVAEQLLPSVVCIQNYKTINTQQYYYGGFPFGYGGQMGGQDNNSGTIQLAGEGSGFVLTNDGYIATNAHVVSGAELLKVVMPSGDICEAALVGVDDDTDLAVIKVDGYNDLIPASLGSSAGIRVGDFVMAIGNPGGMEFNDSVTLGIVSAKDRPLAIDNGTGYTMNTIQTDAAINPGNSGGPLVALDGTVVGICSAKYVDTGYEGLGFAITIDEAMPIIEDLMDYGYVKNRSMIGISGTYVNSVMAQYYSMVEGYYVSVISNPQVGTLQVGDIITKIDGTQVESSSTLKNGIMNKKPGETIELEYYRVSDGNTYTTTVTLVEMGDTRKAK